ncbi:retrovirus-related pol polyprotein from transposon TNT 1-94 [Tanacetum coccineum]
MAKASSTQAWLWHRRLSRVSFDTINLLFKNDIVKGLPKLKYVKDQLCSSYKMGKAKRSTFKKKTIPSSKGRLHLLHMDLCGPMRVESISGKKYILNVNVEEHNNDQAKDAEFEAYEFINPFAPPRTEAVESSSRNVDTSNMHTFYQRHHSDYHWTKDHPPEQQAPRAWYDELSKCLISKGFSKGTIDPTLFTIRYEDDILLVDDIIFRTSDLPIPMSIGTPMATSPKLDADLSGTPVDKTIYQSMIGSLMYLTASRPDPVQAGIQFLGDTRKSTSEYLVGRLGMRCLTPEELEVLANESA